MCVRLLITFLVASDLFVLLLYISILCVFLYFAFNFLHCSTGQKLMLSNAVYSVFYFFLLFLLCALCTIS